MRALIAVSLFSFLLLSCGEGGGGGLKTLSGTDVDFNGTWKMSSVKDDGPLGSATCSDSSVAITRTERSLTIGKYSLRCDTGTFQYNATSEEWVFDIQGTALSFNAHSVGDLGGDYIHVKISLNGGTSFEMSFDPEGDHLNYKQIVADTFKTTAKLTRK